MNRQAVRLDPISIEEFAPRLRLYLSQVCEVAGISKMQLDYWTTKADIQTQGKKQRVYDYEALLFVLLIKQGRDRGLGLPAAIDAAREFLESGAALRKRRKRAADVVATEA